MSSRSWFSRAVLAWYDEGHRDLPWRATRDPYRIWLSEVILQQTRVDQGLPYYHRFVARFPTVGSLAAASEVQVLKLWQGLGYYSRGRNLLEAAQQVVRAHGGTFPSRHGALLTLKGVGDYTAAAIASIAFGEVVPVVDGNVYRVLGRVFGIATPIDSSLGRKEFRALAATLVDPQRPGDHNQAVMELGATVCTPKGPACDRCPVSRRCVARKEDRIDLLPVKGRRTPLRHRHFNYLWIERDEGLLFARRGSGDIWQGLHEMPLIATDTALGTRALKERAGTRALVRLAGPIDHQLSHQCITATLWQAGPGAAARLPGAWSAVPRARVHELPLHRLMEKLLDGLL